MDPILFREAAEHRGTAFLEPLSCSLLWPNCKRISLIVSEDYQFHPSGSFEAPVIELKLSNDLKDHLSERY